MMDTSWKTCLWEFCEEKQNQNDDQKSSCAIRAAFSAGFIMASSMSWATANAGRCWGATRNGTIILISRHLQTVGMGLDSDWLGTISGSSRRWVGCVGLVGTLWRSVISYNYTSLLDSLSLKPLYFTRKIRASILGGVAILQARGSLFGFVQCVYENARENGEYDTWNEFDDERVDPNGETKQQLFVFQAKVATKYRVHTLL